MAWVLGIIAALALLWGAALWRLVIPPAVQLTRLVGDLTPILVDLRATFAVADNPFATLRDTTDRLELAATVAAGLAEVDLERTRRTAATAGVESSTLQSAVLRLEVAATEAAELALAVKVELERTQHAAAAAGDASRTGSKPGRAADVAADAAAAGSAAIGGPDIPA